MPTITSARIIHPIVPKYADAMPEVHVTFDDGTERLLFWYYADEISFQPAEFVGLTKAEAMQLRHHRDLAYVRGSVRPARGI